MSWEPLDPVGFSPCGMAFGASHREYSAACRFYADDAEPDNRILWYFVPDDTPIYEGPSVFWPRLDTPPNEATSAYEREGQGKFVRTQLAHPLGFTRARIHVHGDSEDFAGDALREKYWIDAVPPDQPCPPMPVGLCTLALRCRTIVPWPPCLVLHMNVAGWKVKLNSTDYPFLDGVEFNAKKTTTSWLGIFDGADLHIGLSFSCSNTPMPGTIGAFLLWRRDATPPSEGWQNIYPPWTESDYLTLHIKGTTETFYGPPPVFQGKFVTLELNGIPSSKCKIALHCETLLHGPPDFFLLDDDGKLLLDDGGKLLLD